MTKAPAQQPIVSSVTARGMRQYFLISIVLLVGLALSWSATREAVNSAKREAQNQFFAAADLLTDRIYGELNRRLETSSILSAMLVATGSSQTEFYDYVSVSEGLSQNRFAVLLIEPGADTGEIVVLRAWTRDPALTSFLLQFDLTRLPAVSAATRPGADLLGGTALPLSNRAEAVFSSEDSLLLAAPFPLPDGRTGHVLQVVDAGGFLMQAVRRGSHDGFNVRLEARDSDGLVRRVDHISVPDIALEQAEEMFGAFVQTSLFAVGLQAWDATVWTDDTTFPVDFGRAVVTLFVCLVLTGMVVFIVWTQSQRARRVVEIVDRRTRALKRAHAELEEQNRLLRDLNSDLSTARKAAEHANKAKSEFLATVSHELRTPLNAILGFSQLLSEEALGEIGDERYVEYSKDIYSSGSHLLSLINDILDLAKLEAGRLKIERDAVSPYSLIDKVSGLLEQQVKAKEIDLKTEIDGSLPSSFIGDMLRLRQILINLAANAVKFTETGSVTIRIKQEPLQSGAPGVLLEVEDTGVGIPLAKQDSLFERFTQVDGAHTRRHGGAGLGLAICRELVDRMGGTIHVRSEVGKGTCIWAHLPLEDASGQMDDLEDMTI